MIYQRKERAERLRVNEEQEEPGEDDLKNQMTAVLLWGCEYYCLTLFKSVDNKKESHTSPEDVKGIVCL